jgi:hypothetical protein
MRVLSLVVFVIISIITSSRLYSQDNSLLSKNSIIQNIDSLNKENVISGNVKNKLANMKARNSLITDSVSKLKNLRYSVNSLPVIRTDTLLLKVLNKKLSFSDDKATKLIKLNPIQNSSQKIDSTLGELLESYDSIPFRKLSMVSLTRNFDRQLERIEGKQIDGELLDSNGVSNKLGNLQIKSIDNRLKGLASIDGSKINELKLPSLNSDLANINSPVHVDVPQLGAQPKILSGIPYLTEKVSGLKAPLTDVGIDNQLSMSTGLNLNRVDMNSTLPSFDAQSSGLNNVSNSLSGISNSTKEISKYQEGLKTINSEQLNDESIKKEIESSAGSIQAGKELETQLSVVEQQKALIAKWNSNPEYQKEMAVTKAKEQAVNHFAGSEKELIGVMNKLSELKTKSKDAEGVIDLYKSKTANSMKGKPFKERLEFGLTLQLTNRSSNLLIDFNPYIGYKVSGRFTVGTGWVQRFPLSTKSYSYIDSETLFGFRSFVQFRIKGGSFIKFETELLNQPQKAIPLQPIMENLRTWRPNYLLGFKQSFKFSSRVGAHVLILYNLVDNDHQSPYADKIQARFGFEFYPKKVVKKD